MIPLITQLVDAPMLSYPGAALTIMQILTIATSYSNEKSPQTRTPYSKFFSKDKLTNEGQIFSSRIGMTILYGLPFVVTILTMFVRFLVTERTATYTIVPLSGMLCAMHFMKRVLEVQYVHSYSGSMPQSLAYMIGFFYSIQSMIGGLLGTLDPEFKMSLYGTIIFLVGTLGNLYHHILLARLRRQPKSSTIKDDNYKMKQTYLPPRGGLFDYVAAPHYLFEIIAWLGIAITSQHGNLFLTVLGMCSYLGGRSVAHNEWNREQFKSEWPSSRKNMIPFVF